VKRLFPALILSLVASVLPGAPARAATASAAPTPVFMSGVLVSGITSSNDIAVGTGFVFLADSGGNAVAVMNLDGTQAGDISVPDPTGLAISGTTLYVASSSGSKIYVYDISAYPATLTTSYPTAPLDSPGSLALSDGRLWFTGHKSGTSYLVLGSMKTDGTDVQGFLPADTEYWQYACASIDHSDFAPGRIFLHSAGGCGEPDGLYLYDSSAAPPTLLSTYGIGADWGSYYSQQVSVLPDGSGALISWSGGIGVWSLDSLSGPTFDYQAPASWSLAGSSVAAAPGFIASNGNLPIKRAMYHGVFLWKLGQVQPIAGFAIPPTEVAAAPPELAFNASGNELYVVSTTGTSVYFYAVRPYVTTLSLHRSAHTVDFGRSVTFTATLVGPGRGQIVHFDVVTNNSSKEVGSCKTDAHGRCSWSVRPSSNAYYEASYDGMGKFGLSVSAKMIVDVAEIVAGKMYRYYGTSGGYALYHHSSKVFYTARARPGAVGGNSITVYLWVNLGSGWKQGGHQSFNVGVTGRLRIYFKGKSLPKGRYRLRSESAGAGGRLGGTSSYSYFEVTA
jgi:hypothetical protein